MLQLQDLGVDQVKKPCIGLIQHSESYYYIYSGECMNLDFHVTLQTHSAF